jgi:hypothetical protein
MKVSRIRKHSVLWLSRAMLRFIAKIFLPDEKSPAEAGPLLELRQARYLNRSSSVSTRTSTVSTISFAASSASPIIQACGS